MFAEKNRKAMFRFRKEELYLVSIFIIGGFHFIATQNISVVDESCKKQCSCCANSTCKPYSYICSDGCKTGYHSGRCWNKCPENCIICQDKPNLYGVAECLTCKDGYYSTTVLYQCQSRCPDECVKCYSKSNCTSCKDGFYASTDQPGPCFPCQEGCLSCVSEVNCNFCEKGFYPSQSSRTDRVCKSCPRGCVSCTSSEHCQQCITGFYGATCQEHCSIGCTNNQCSKIYGQCHCEVGFAGDRCDMCVVGKYGEKCKKKCSANCLNGICKRESGECHSCEEAYRGPYCNNCTTGKYGHFCNQSCPENCFQSVCDRSTGNCFGCSGNYGRDKCDVCLAGKYGITCEYDCPGNCLDFLCDRYSGDCFSCKRNSVGSKCDSCKAGYYGQSCDKTCPLQCLRSECDLHTGICSHGCNAGYSGDRCCLNNSFCQECDLTHTCSKCIAGHFGDTCEKECQSVCENNTCDRTDGTCKLCTGQKCQEESTSWVAFITGTTLSCALMIVTSVLLVKICRRRSKCSRKTRNTEVTESISYINMPQKDGTCTRHEDILSNTYEQLEAGPGGKHLYDDLK